MEKNIVRKNWLFKYVDWKRLASIVTKAILGITVLYFIISMVEWTNVISAFEKADKNYILISLLLLPLNIGSKALKWHTMLKSAKTRPRPYETFGSLMFGISLGAITPIELGEYAGRALHISEARKSHIVGLSLVDKIQIFAVTATVGSICLIILIITNKVVVILFSFAVLLLFLFVFSRFRKIITYLDKINTHFFKREIITKILTGANLLTRKMLWLTIALTVVLHIVIVMQMFFLINAFSNINLIHAFIGTSAIMFVKSCLPVSLGDLGIREASAIYFFSYYGISNVASLNASLLLFFINIFIPSLIGIYFIRHQNYPLLQVVHLIKSMKPKN